jgi:hypothetical protein
VEQKMEESFYVEKMVHYLNSIMSKKKHGSETKLENLIILKVFLEFWFLPSSSLFLFLNVRFANEVPLIDIVIDHSRNVLYTLSQTSSIDVYFCFFLNFPGL